MRLDPRATRHVRRDMPLLELFDQAETVRGLLEHPGWAVALEAIEAEVAVVNRTLASGDEPHSQAMYAKLHGRLGGLVFLPDVLDAIVQGAETRMAEQQRKHEGTTELVPGGIA